MSTTPHSPSCQPRSCHPLPLHIRLLLDLMSVFLPPHPPPFLLNDVTVSKVTSENPGFKENSSHLPKVCDRHLSTTSSRISHLALTDRGGLDSSPHGTSKNQSTLGLWAVTGVSPSRAQVPPVFSVHKPLGRWCWEHSPRPQAVPRYASIPGDAAMGRHGRSQWAPFLGGGTPVQEQ